MLRSILDYLLSTHLLLCAFAVRKIISDALQPLFGDADIFVSRPFSRGITSAWHGEHHGEDGAYCFFCDIEGKKSHALLTAPNPERKPKIRVPTTVRRDRTFCHRLAEGNAAGSGMNDRKNRKSPTGRAVRMMRSTDGRRRACAPVSYQSRSQIGWKQSDLLDDER